MFRFIRTWVRNILDEYVIYWISAWSGNRFYAMGIYLENTNLNQQTNIHIFSYYKLFLYFNLCLSVMLDSLSCSFTSISIQTQIKVKEQLVVRKDNFVFERRTGGTETSKIGIPLILDNSLDWYSFDAWQLIRLVFLWS